MVIPSPAGRVVAAVFAVLLLAASAPAVQPPPRSEQEPQQGPPQDPQQDPQQDPAEGKIVSEVVIEPPDSADLIRRLLKTRAGQPLRIVDARDDIQTLYDRLKVIARFLVEDVDGGVRVIFEVEESKTYDHFEFRGLSKFTEREVRTVLGLDSRQRINRLAAEQYAATLRERYRRRGHVFVDVRIDLDDATSTLTFYVDEGPDVRVRRVTFIGNRSVPGWAPLHYYDNLLDSPELASLPGGKIMSGNPYSPEIVDEDLDRLRLWYRMQGFLDARAELAGVVFVEEHTEVDLTIRVVEGRRYRIASVDLLQHPAAGPDAPPLYPRDEVMERVKVEPGETYDYKRIEADKIAIARFYGERGHPRDGEYGRGIEDAFRIGDPIEVVDPQRAEVSLTYEVYEGTPKKLRAVRLRGNTDTRSRVVMRKIFQLPGETLDMTKVQRSLGSLDALRYFQDPESYGGVRFELLPVEGDSNAVDLGVDVTEGDTGQFLWGAGLSTAFGAQVRFELTKRNFDIARPPRSLNPISWIVDVAENEAFHGAGQELSLMLAPGTEVSLFNLSFYDPDIFRSHFDTIGLSVDAYKRLQRYDSFDLDSLGAEVGLRRNFTEDLSIGASFRQETDYVENPTASAPTIVYEAEGRTEMRGLRLNLNVGAVDYALEPTSGFRTRIYGELVGGPFGADEDFWKAGVSQTLYIPVYRDSRDRTHVLRWRSGFDYGHGFGRSDDLFLTERFYMGGNNLRGFDQRRAGPTQFDNPVGGEARLLSSFEYKVPLVSTRRVGEIRQTDVLQGVFFTDFGMLGLSIDDLGPPRLSVGLGLRINIPVLNVPIALDVGWPIVRERTDHQRQFYFTVSRF